MNLVHSHDRLSVRLLLPIICVGAMGAAMARPAVSVPAKLTAQARAQGGVWILVELRVPNLSAVRSDGAGELVTRQSAIQPTQDRLLGRMQARNLRAVKRMRYTPYVAMYVDEAALQAVAQDPDVV